VKSSFEVDSSIIEALIEPRRPRNNAAYDRADNPYNCSTVFNSSLKAAIYKIFSSSKYEVYCQAPSWVGIRVTKCASYKLRTKC